MNRPEETASTDVQFSRPRNPEATTSELRGDCPRWILNVLDAVSMASADNRSRMAVVNEVLGDWAKKKIHEASLVTKLSGGNPPAVESGEGA